MLTATMLSLDDLRSLSLAQTAPAISMFLPSHPISREVLQDPARLRNLAREAVRRLVEGGHRAAVARDLIAPAFSLAEDEQFWLQSGLGVALFLGPGYKRCHRVPVPLREELVVGQHFCVRPLLSLLAENGEFFIVALSAMRIRLFQATRYRVEPVNGLKLPNGVRSVSEMTDYQDTVSGHPVSHMPVWRSRHGMGKVSNAGEAPEELRRTELMEYLVRGARAVSDYFSGKRVPVVLAALPVLQGNFRINAHINGLLREGLAIDPEHRTPEDLRDKAYDLVRPSFAAAQEQAIERFNALFGEHNPKAGTEPADIVEGTRYGRVDTLFLADGAQLWGRIEEADERVEIHDAPMPGDEDLINRAIIETLLHGGTIAVMAKTRFPIQRSMLSLFRY